MVKVYIDGELITGNETPIVLLWENDGERREFARVIMNMPDKDGPRGFIKYPASMSFDQASEVIKEAVASL